MKEKHLIKVCGMIVFDRVQIIVSLHSVIFQSSKILGSLTKNRFSYYNFTPQTQCDIRNSIKCETIKKCVNRFFFIIKFFTFLIFLIYKKMGEIPILNLDECSKTNKFDVNYSQPSSRLFIFKLL